MHSILELLVRALTDGFILVTLFWMIFWDSEPCNPIRRYWIPKVQPFFIWLGLNAEWRMFSPDPPKRAIWPRVRLTMRGGDFVDWETAPWAEIGILDKLCFKKYHKFYHEVARPRVAFHTKRDFVEYLLQRKLHPEPCVKVEIYMCFQAALPFAAQTVEEPKTYQQLVYTFHPAEQAPS